MDNLRHPFLLLVFVEPLCLAVLGISLSVSRFSANRATIPLSRCVRVRMTVGTRGPWKQVAQVQQIQKIVFEIVPSQQVEFNFCSEVSATCLSSGLGRDGKSGFTV